MPLLLNRWSMFSPSEIRALFALCFLYATRMLGLFMVLPVFALYSSEYDGSTTILIGLSLGIYGLTQGMLQIPFGLLSDRLGRKPLIIVGMLLFLAGSLLCAYANSIYLIVVGRALQGAGAVAGVIMALLSDVTREQVRTRAMAVVGGSIGVAFAVAMVTGPLVASYWGMSGIFWLTAILAAIGIIAVLLVVPNPSVRHSGHEVVPVPAMLTRVLADRQLLRVNAGIFFLHFAQIATWVVIPVMLENSFDFHRDQHWMLYLATMGGGFVLMLPFVWYAETRHKLKPVFIGAIAVLAIAEGVMATTGSLFQQLVFGLLLFFVAFNLLEATLPSLVSKLAPAGIKGTAMGVYSTSQFLGTFVGGLVGGVVAFRYGGSALFVVVMASVLIWLTIAITMRAPRVLRSIEIDLRADSGVDIKSNMINIKGIEDIVVIPGENIAYVKVDDEQFDEAVFDRQIQQYINQK